jgi:CubicO group peptidase (beta-lactamase class C family)
VRSQAGETRRPWSGRRRHPRLSGATNRTTLTTDRVEAVTTEAYWQERLGELAREHRVPGASLAVLADGTVWTAAGGHHSLEAGVEVTSDSVFQIGSITKVETTTSVRRLVDEGRVDPDRWSSSCRSCVWPIRANRSGDGPPAAHPHQRYRGRPLPGHRPRRRRRGALRGHLPRARLFPPGGAAFSYCNSGFVIAGRLVEILGSQIWDRALCQHLAAPLGLRRTVTLPEAAIRFRTSLPPPVRARPGAASGSEGDCYPAPPGRPG